MIYVNSIRLIKKVSFFNYDISTFGREYSACRVLTVLSTTNQQKIHSLPENLLQANY